MKKLEINCPEGHEIDLEKSDLSKGVVFFKEVKKVLTYEDIANTLFKCKNCYFTTRNGLIANIEISYTYNDSNNSTTKEQLESILALNKLCNVAKYLNGDWLPNFNNKKELKFEIYFSVSLQSIQIFSATGGYSSVYFKTKDLAQQAIEILGKEEIIKALTLNH